MLMRSRMIVFGALLAAPSFAQNPGGQNPPQGPGQGLVPVPNQEGVNLNAGAPPGRGRRGPRGPSRPTPHLPDGRVNLGR